MSRSFPNVSITPASAGFGPRRECDPVIVLWDMVVSGIGGGWGVDGRPCQ
ncbi:MAG: hypothetical protein WCK86_16605 [Planctomycetia bacterium]